MSYIAVTLNHFRTVRAWALAHEAAIDLDMLSMQLTVRARNRYFTLYPRFLARRAGGLAHCTELNDEVSGFIGWLPYRNLRWEMASDKLAFRQFLLDHELPVPAAWQSSELASAPYLMKRSAGSFGYAQRGPYHPGQTPAMPPGEAGQAYAEEFIHGTNLKLWVWGDAPFFAHVDDYPTLQGDGEKTLQQLLDARLAAAGIALDNDADRAAVEDSLRHQNVSRDSVLAQGSSVWIDYRYGRLYHNTRPGPQSDNRLSQLDAQQAQIARAIAALTPRLQAEFSAPVLYALDGVIDADGKIWWLEMNSNPILPPEGYPHIFSTLFGTPIAS